MMRENKMENTLCYALIWKVPEEEVYVVEKIGDSPEEVLENFEKDSKSTDYYLIEFTSEDFFEVEHENHIITGLKLQSLKKISISDIDNLGPTTIDVCLGWPIVPAKESWHQ